MPTQSEGAANVDDAAKAFDAAIRDEISGIGNGIRDLSARARALGEAARGVNGLAGQAATWARDLDVIAEKVEAEGPEVSKAILGREMPEIKQTMNAELAAAVASDPARRR